MKVIVTGANGFIGSSLINKLIENGVDVLAIDLSFRNTKIPQNKHISFKEMSIEDISSIEGTVLHGEYDVFYHLAWKGVNGADKGNINIQIHNIDMSAKCALTAKNIGCKRFLCAGTIAEQAVKSLPSLTTTSSGMIYGVAKECTHLFLETYCKNIGLDLVWMQFSNIYGPKNKTGNLVSYTITELMNNRIASFGPADQQYDFIYVDDLINAVYKLGIMKTDKCFYYIGSGKPRLLKDYLKIIGEICDKPELIQIGVRPDDGIKYDYWMFDNTKLVNDIGDYVTMPFEEGIAYTVDNFLI